MDLLILGTGMGIVGGLFPSPLHLIALSQIALRRWLRALLILTAPQLVIDAALLLTTFLFYRHLPHSIAHSAAYVGGVVLLAYGAYSLLENQHKSQDELACSPALTYAGVSAAAIAELTAPGTWIYWLTIAGPILGEGKQNGYWHVVPFFVGGLAGYYGAAILSLWLMAWGASLYSGLRQRMFALANVLLLVLGVYYLVHAFLTR